MKKSETIMKSLKAVAKGAAKGAAIGGAAKAGKAITAVEKMRKARKNLYKKGKKSYQEDEK